MYRLEARDRCRAVAAAFWRRSSQVIVVQEHYRILLKQVQDFALLFPEEILFLFEQAEGMASKKGAIVDVGTFKGGSAIALALGVESGGGKDLVHTIDAFEEHPLFPAQGLWGTQGDVYREFHNNVRRFGLDGRIQLIVGHSEAVAQKWNHRIKLLFYDGSVVYEAVKAEVAVWASFLIPGGLLVIHIMEIFL